MVKALMAISILTVVYSLIAGLVSLVYGVGLVTPYVLDTGYVFTLFLAIPVFVNILTLSGYPLLGYYFLLVGIIIAACTWTILRSYKGYWKELTMKATSREHSPIFDIGGLVSVNVFITFVIVFIALLFGASDTGGPSTSDPERLLFELANASVWEEVIVRILMIGLPLLVVDLIWKSSNQRRKALNLPFKNRQSRPWYSYILGGKFEIGVPEVVFVLASATIFGFAHYVGGWGAWKIPAAAIGGVGFGYLFLKFGLPAAITMHFTVDYSGVPSQVFNVGNTLDIILIVFWLGLGFVFTIYYLTRIGEFLTGRKFLEERPQTVGIPWPQPMAYGTGPPAQFYYPPIQYPQPPPGQPLPPVVPQQARYGGYVCPVCGNTEARWVNGRFQCLRCGNLS